MAEQTTKKKFKIAVLTSGGDSAGMNAAVRAVVKGGISKGCEMWVVREGYEGLVRGNTEAAPPTVSLESCTAGPVPSQVAELSFVKNLRFGDGELFKQGEGDAEDRPDKKTLKGRYIVKVGWDDVRGWMGEGGTLIGTARCAAFRQVEGRMTAAYNLIKEGIDALVVCGGDGSLTGADRLRAEWPELVAGLLQQGLLDATCEQSELYGHLKIVGLVGSIDNDMAMTDLTIGAPTALHRICEAIDNINSTASSHSRAFVVEVMGRHCGWLAFAGADFIFIPENPPEAHPWEEDMCEIIQRHRKQGKRKTIVIVAEGAHDRELNPIRPEYVKEILTERLGLDTRVTTLGHTQRGGVPCPTLQGVEAVNALLEATPETPSYMIGISENQITRKPLMEAVEQAISEKDFVKAMSLRDPEFKDYLDAFILTSALDAGIKLPEPKILLTYNSMGAPAGGMNAATRAAVRYCLERGHTPLAINNGFPGLLDDSVTQLSWLRVDNWMTRGGSELGTNRTLPNIDLGAVASKFQGHRFDALFMIGGFEAFSALLILEKARESYPAFNIPMVHLPATISNNVPLTEFSLGSDTSLNALVDACDSIKQSAQANRNRVFVVETQGGQCGYLATLGALAVGAAVVYTPEVGINLDLLRMDLNFLKTRYSLDVKGKSEGRLVIMYACLLNAFISNILISFHRSEKASNVYTTDVVTKILAEEGRGLFDSRSASLGHTLQGGIPSPIDRARAVRLSIKCMKFLEQHALSPSRRSPPESAAVITIQGTSIKLTPVHEVVQHADMKKRIGKNPWWKGIKQLTETLGGRTELLE
ncbi:6-phosphofructokinase alpha subunit [Rhizoctonia solani AG-1 IA]|uniref:6-phosphofructokinase n=1 Tax=Thanatephorus cucumeris (strain AG1-IA) TaxID=983506 RepID=L8WWM7_THACA|nr:6-phosphofructokinase alpha subunit [Rhizoctonia solani AG-1 IA]